MLDYLNKLCGKRRKCTYSTDTVTKFCSGWNSNEIYVGEFLRNWMLKRKFQRCHLGTALIWSTTFSSDLVMGKAKSRRSSVEQHCTNNMRIICVRFEYMAIIYGTLSSIKICTISRKWKITSVPNKQCRIGNLLPFKISLSCVEHIKYYQCSSNSANSDI